MGPEKVDLQFPRQPNVDLQLLEERERQDRIAQGVDPLLLGKHHKMQTELLSQNPSTILPGSASISQTTVLITEKASELLHDSAAKASTIMHDSAAKASTMMHNTSESIRSSGIVQNTTETISNVTSSMMGKVNEYVEVAKEKMGMAPIDISSMASEEKERLRRMNETVDPMVEARKHRVEDELLQNVKPTI